MRAVACALLVACGGSADKPMPDAADTTAPTVSIANLTVGGAACVATPGCDCGAVAGDTIGFDVIASDDTGIAAVSYNTSIASTPLTMTAAPPGAPAAVTTPFTLQVPASAGVETAVLVASAVDPSSNSASSPAVQLCVRPAVQPRQPVVAWEDTSPGQAEIYLEQWNGSAWVELGGSATGGGVSATSGGNSQEPAVALQPNGDPVVAWIEQATGGGIEQVFLKRWNGTAWEELGGSATGGGVSQAAAGNIGAQDVSIAVDSAGRIYVAWKFAETPGNVCCNLWVYVSRWNGSAWEELASSASGTGINGTADGSAPTIRIDTSDRPVVAWNQEISSGCWVWLRRWSGSAWDELASSASGNGLSGAMGGAADPALAIDHAGNPVALWALDSATAFDAVRFNGTSWDTLGTLANGTCVAGLHYTATVDATNAPVAGAWPLGGGASQVVRWNGTTWADTGLTGATGQIALDADATGIVAAWQASGKIAVARWDGASWQPLGSALGTTASLPSIAAH
ncbi:MAG: hypothetical protein ACM31C_06790 [Acidobacteriota bacterium]